VRITSKGMRASRAATIPGVSAVSVMRRRER
jgi:hypothetical protein